MGRERKSPQQKKQLALTKDHFVRAEHPHAFRKNWPRKKARINRNYRRRAEEILSRAKKAISADKPGIDGGDLTAAHLKQSVSRKRLRKSGKVSLAERIIITQDTRQKSIGRNVKKNELLADTIEAALATLQSLAGPRLENTVERIARLLRGGDPNEWYRLSRSTDKVDQAIYFVEQVEKWGNFDLINALQNNERARESYVEWKRKADRILAKKSRLQQLKLEQKAATEMKLKRLVKKDRRSRS